MYSRLAIQDHFTKKKERNNRMEMRLASQIKIVTAPSRLICDKLSPRDRRKCLKRLAIPKQVSNLSPLSPPSPSPSPFQTLPHAPPAHTSPSQSATQTSRAYLDPPLLPLPDYPREQATLGPRAYCGSRSRTRSGSSAVKRGG